VAERRLVKVTILNQGYTLVTAEDPLELETLAREIDDLLLSIAGKSPSADSTRIAVIGCLELAGRLRDVKREFTELKNRIDRKTEQLSDMLERAVGED
jgi:cell division protein ZapA (FtsZ GTPase activity inhibitor)